jgi:hypothetical protein
MPRQKPSREKIIAAANEIKSWNPQLWKDWVDVCAHIDEMNEEKIREKLQNTKTLAWLHLVKSGHAADNADALNIIGYVETVLRMENDIPVHNPNLALPD